MRRAVRVLATFRDRLAWRANLMALLLLGQTLAAIFLAGDVMGEMNLPFGWPVIDLHTGLEALVTLCLGVGIGLSAVELRRVLERQHRAETAVSIASGNFATMLDVFFTRWGLTSAERDVALLVIKGLDNDAIAATRGVAVGTVRSQTARIYAKAEVSGRAQLLSIFIEELLAEPLVPGISQRATLADRS